MLPATKHGIIQYGSGFRALILDWTREKKIGMIKSLLGTRDAPAHLPGRRLYTPAPCRRSAGTASRACQWPSRQSSGQRLARDQPRARGGGTGEKFKARSFPQEQQTCSTRAACRFSSCACWAPEAVPAGRGLGCGFPGSLPGQFCQGEPGCL